MRYFDITSETISHFIGLFHLTVEEARMRVEYDKFRALKAEAQEHPELPQIDVRVKAPYELTDFYPAVSYTPAADFLPAPVPEEYGELPDFDPVLNAGGPLPEVIGDYAGFPGLPDFGFFAFLQPLPFLEPASSIAVLAVQTNYLHDSDYFDVAGYTATLIGAEYFDQQLDQLVTAAESLRPLETPAMPSDDAGFVALSFHLAETIAQTGTDDSGGASLALFRGHEAAGIHVNGKAVTELPAWKDNMPAYLTSSEDDDDQPIHDVLHGGNVLVNEVSMAVSWLYAPVMAVAGDSHSINIVSQVNVWNDTDHVAGTAVHAGAIDTAATTASNVASILHEAIAPPTAAADVADPAMPSNWIVTRIDGDVINTSWLQQYNFVIDNDVTTLTFSASETTLIFGGNTTTNSVSLYELGFAYDLIVIGGNVIDLSVISQMNVLLDTDIVTLDGFGGGASTGDNLLWNHAHIYEAGIDSHVELSAGYQQLLDDLQSGADSVPDEVLADSAFAGSELLRVLYVDGSLINSQIIEQINILGDADQVAQAAEAALGDGAGGTVTTGSNALLNLASISEFGIDSTIHLGGEVYSDAILYQAELIVTDGPPTAPPAPGALASEAVLFLADDMIEGEATPEEAPALAVGDSGSLDVMQTMLA